MNISPGPTTRLGVLQIARSWLGTSYHHMGRVKGAGVDCAMFPLEVYREAGLLPEFEIPFYPQDWHLHRSEEMYLEIVERYAIEIMPNGVADVEKGTGYRGQVTEKQHPVPCDLSPVPCLPGDFVLYQFGRTWSHGAIVIEWPMIIHAVAQHGVILSDGELEGFLVGRAKRFFSLWK